MRIIGGNLKGKPIITSPKFHGRPTSAFAKEGLLNVLRHRIDLEGLNVLDLFAGTGAIGLEFLSLGAKYVTYVEQDKFHARTILSNKEHLGVSNFSVLVADGFKIMKQLKTSFDIIFADPPHDHPLLKNLPKLLLESSLMNKDTIFILEHNKHQVFSDIPELCEHRRYGHVHFSFFKKQTD